MTEGSRARLRTCRHCGAEFQDLREGRSAPIAYCSAECRKAARTARLAAASLAYGECEFDGCGKPKRSGRAAWCEMHYGRIRRNGNLTEVRRRTPNGACHHCGVDVASKRIFCSELCRRRDRLKLPGRELICAVCGGEIPEDARADAVFCSEDCGHLHERARRYGIAGRELAAKMAAATGCEVCGKETDDLHVDHHHHTGMVRGLLCTQCNVGIGMFKEDPRIMQAAIEYLGRYGNGLGDEQPQGAAA